VLELLARLLAVIHSKKWSWRQANEICPTEVVYLPFPVLCLRFILSGTAQEGAIMCHEVAVLAVSDIWVRGTSALRWRAGWRWRLMFLMLSLTVATSRTMETIPLEVPNSPTLLGA